MWSAGANNGFGQYIPVASLPASALGSQAANTHLAGPASGAAASPTFRGLVTNDLPSQLPASVGVGTAATAAGVTVAPSTASASGLTVTMPTGATGTGLSVTIPASSSATGLNIQTGGNFTGNLLSVHQNATGVTIDASGNLTMNSYNGGMFFSGGGQNKLQFGDTSHYLLAGPGVPLSLSGNTDGVLVSGGSASTTQFTVKGFSGQSAALLDTVNSTATTHYFQVMPSGHLILGGTIPTLTNGTNAASATITAGSTDAKGDCVVTTTAAPTAATTLISVVYAAAYATAPEVLITAYGTNAASALLYVSARSTTGFTLTSVNAPPASSSVSIGYLVIQ